MFKHVGNYLLSNVATKALGIISIPIYTYMLNPEDYGMISLYIAYSNIAAVLLTTNSHTSISRYFFEEKEDFKVFVGNSLIISIISTLILGFLGILFLYYFIVDLTLPNWTFGLIILATLSSIFSSIFMQIHLPQNNSALIAKTTIIAGYGQFIINILTVCLSPSPKWIFLIFAKLFGAILLNFIFFKHIKEFIECRLNFLHFKYIFNYSLPLIPYVLGSTLLAQIDRIMISGSSNVAETGMYSLAVSLAFLVPIVGFSIDQAWIPSYFKFMKDKNYIRHDQECKTNLIYWSLTAAGFILFFLEPTKILIQKEFHHALILIPIIILGYLFEFYFRIYGKNIGYVKKTVYSSIIYLSAGIINVFLNYYTLKKFGYQVAAINTVLSFICLFIFAWFVSKHILKTHTLPIVHLFPSFLTVIGSCFVFYINKFVVMDNFIYIAFKYMTFAIILFIFYRDFTWNFFETYLKRKTI